MRSVALEEPVEARTDVHGHFYTIRAMLKGPSGASALVVSIWCVRAGNELPRLVTAYPERTRTA